MAGIIRKVTDWTGITDPETDLAVQAGQTLTPSTELAKGIYTQAENERLRILAGQGGIPWINPEKITTTDINPDLYKTNVNTDIQMPDGTWRARGYTSTDATAANFTGQLTPAEVIKARNVVNLANADVNTNIQANQLGDAAQTDLVGVGGTNVQGVTMDRGAANAVRGEALDVARSIAGAPSAAMSQFQAGQSQVIADQLAMAAKARGAERAGARRDAIIAAGSQGAQGNLAASALSAQEEQAKRVAGAAALSNVRTQDTGLVTTQAQLDQARATQQAQIDAQRSELQAQLDAAIAQGNTAAINAIKVKQGELDLEARKATVASDLGLANVNKDIDLGRAGFTQQTEIYNAGAGNTAQTQYKEGVKDLTLGAQTGTTNVSVGNADRTTGAAKDLTNAQNTLIGQATGLEGQAKITGKQLEVGQATGNADRSVGIVTTNKKATDTATTQDVANDITATGANAGNILTDKGITQGGVKGTLDTGVSATGVVAGNERTAVGAQAAQGAREDKENAATVDMIAQGAAMASDERLKHDIYKIGGVSGGDVYGDGGRTDSEGNADIYSAPPEGDEDGKKLLATEDDLEAIKAMKPEDVRAWADEVAPIIFRYNEGTEDGGANPHIGFGARQVAETGPLGRATVYEDRKGDLSMDYIAATLMMSKAAIDTANEALAATKRRGTR